MEVPDPNADAPAPENDMAKHFTTAGAAVLDLMKDLPPDPNDPDQRSATPTAPEPTQPSSQEPSPPEPPLPKAPPAPPQPAAGEDDTAFQKELAEASKLPKNAHPNVAKGINAMKAVAERERTAAREQAAKYAEAQREIAELKKKAMTPDIEAELKDAKEFRRVIDIKSDKEFKNKYTAPLEGWNKRAGQILTRHGLGEAVAQSISKLGGLSAAARSSEKVPAELDEKQPTWAEWIDQTLLPRVPSVDRNRLQGIISSAADLEDAMQAEMDAVSKDAGTFEEKIAKRNYAALEEGINESRAALGRIAQKWDIPANVTPEQKTMIEKHNARYEKVKSVVEEMAQNIIGNPRMQGRAVLGMGQAVYLAEVNSELMTTTEAQADQIKKLSDELSAIKRSGSITASLNTQPTGATPEQNLATISDHRGAVDAALKEVE